MPSGKQTLNIQQHLSATRKRKNAYHVKNIEHVYNSESEKLSCQDYILIIWSYSNMKDNFMI